MPVSLEQALHDLAVRHRVSLGSYSNTVVRQVIALLNRVDADIVGRIAQGDFGDRKHSQAELERLLVDVRVLESEGWAVIDERLNGDFADLTGVELNFEQDLMSFAGSKLGVEVQTMRLPVVQVVAAVKARPFQGRLLKEWLADAEAGAARRVREAIRQGFTESQSIEEIIRRIRGTRAASYTDGILEVSRRGAEAMVRTAISHVSSVAAQETYNAYPDLIVGVEWVATLDSHTTLICMGLDGRVFPIDSGPRPPAHINCRSVTIPRLKGMGPTPRTTYADWFARQPADVQDQVLGPNRAALYRDGGLKLDRFTDNKMHILTLDQLRQRDADAFAKAGL